MYSSPLIHVVCLFLRTQATSEARSLARSSETSRGIESPIIGGTRQLAKTAHALPAAPDLHDAAKAIPPHPSIAYKTYNTTPPAPPHTLSALLPPSVLALAPIRSLLLVFVAAQALS